VYTHGALQHFRIKKEAYSANGPGGGVQHVQTNTSKKNYDYMSSCFKKGVLVCQRSSRGAPVVRKNNL